MRRKRIMVMGPSGCGKTSLAHILDNMESRHHSTQGEGMESPLRKHPAGIPECPKSGAILRKHPAGIPECPRSGAILRKTQDIIYGKNTIDVPGSYLEIPWMYKYLIQAAQDACHILLLVDQSRCQEVYSPGFAKVFRCPVNGVVMKSDLSPEQEEKCIRQLERAKAAEPYFRISMVNGTGVDQLRAFFLERYQM